MDPIGSLGSRSEMAGRVITAERGASQVKRGLRWARPTPAPKPGAVPSDARVEHPANERTYSTPESLFMDQYEPLARAITLIARDREVARDAVQEAFARLCREWPTVSGYQNQVAWVRTVALNQVRDQQRRWARRGRLSLSFEQIQDASEGPTDLSAHQTPELPAGADLSLWQAVRRLPERQRTAVGLFYIADLNVSEVAAAMGVSAGTVKRHLDRARNSLRARMEA